jgi:hypothetical protein
MILFPLCVQMPITVAAPSKAWTVFTCSKAGIVGSNPTWGINVSVRLFCLCAALCASRGLATGWSPVQGILPNVWKDQETEKVAKAQQRAVKPQIDAYKYFLNFILFYLIVSKILALSLCCFLFPWFKYSRRCLVLRHRQSLLFTSSQTPNSTQTKLVLLH